MYNKIYLNRLKRIRCINICEDCDICLTYLVQNQSLGGALQRKCSCKFHENQTCARVSF